jgi:hypothetical protein
MEITKEMKDVAESIGQVYRQKIADANSVATGKLKDFKVECQMEGSFFEVIFILEDYWKYVENGRRAGAKFPPVNAIKEWIKVKPIIPRPIKGKIPTTNQLAYLIGRKISRDGIPAKKLLESSLNESSNLIDKLVSLIADEMEKEFNEENI